MALQYPTNFTKGMPMMLFKSYKFRLPLADMLKCEINKGSAGAEISLYIPGGFNENMGANWATTEVIGGSAGDSWKSAMATEMGAFLRSQVGSKIASTVAGATGKTTFPTDMLIFQSANPMSLNFTYTMIPYDQGESAAILNIINSFKKSVLPKSDGATGLLSFPDVWDITFRNVQGLGMPEKGRYEDMALKSCDVSFSDNQTSLLTFHDERPVSVRLTLSFESVAKPYIKI